MKYKFCGLENGKVVKLATAIVDPTGVVKWDNEIEGKKIESMLTENHYPPLGKGVLSPIDIASYEDWKRVPYVIRGSYFWCEGYYENEQEQAQDNKIKVTRA